MAGRVRPGPPVPDVSHGLGRDAVPPAERDAGGGREPELVGGLGEAEEVDLAGDAVGDVGARARRHGGACCDSLGWCLYPQYGVQVI